MKARGYTVPCLALPLSARPLPVCWRECDPLVPAAGSQHHNQSITNANLLDNTVFVYELYAAKAWQHCTHVQQRHGSRTVCRTAKSTRAPLDSDTPVLYCNCT